ncbi:MULTISPECIES: putative motility protein [unclassified Halomonas]|uniref:putative motility protein n=1 Tax=unclassified Halomonas TaxID=2609666 RepID=UPI0006D97461|nr:MULTISPECIES: putative motility protein [unclassified Halomonas]KPQ18920.1 MAG: putative motility protein [Halomonas sp. HL-93]SBR48904.1 Putative motility protein [Halomonas sp. HL-93]SNY96051.1 Putative motility protein [Halomonas sp. hl-4]
MDVAVSNAVSTSLSMNQAQSAEQAQMKVFKDALNTQEQQVSEIMASADMGAEPDLAQEGSVGTQVNTFA